MQRSDAGYNRQKNIYIKIQKKKKKEKEKGKHCVFFLVYTLSAVMRSACVFNTGLLHD